MSKKFLNRTVVAILVLAIISTMFLGGVISADTPAEATYEITGSVEMPGDKQVSAEITFESDTPFSDVRFQVDTSKVLLLNTSNGTYSEATDDPIALSGAELVDAVTVSGSQQPYIEVSGPTKGFEDDPYAVLFEGAEGTLYTSITLKLNFVSIDGSDKNSSANGVSGWRRYVIDIPVVEMSGEKAYTTFNVTNKKTVIDPFDQNFTDFIHVHCYNSKSIFNDGKFGPKVPEEGHYAVQTAGCYVCGNMSPQVKFDDRVIDDFYLVVRGISTSYNNDGTLNIHAHVDGIPNIQTNLQLIVCPSDGNKYHQYGGNNEEGQAKQDISVVTNLSPSSYAGNGLSADAQMFTFTGIPAKDIGDKLYFTILSDEVRTTTDEEGQETSTTTLEFGPTTSYSLADYCYDVIAGGENVVGAQEDDAVLYASLLDYGAAAQTYAGETENLANEKLAENFKNAYTNCELNVTDEVITENVVEECRVYGTSLILRANASLKFYFVLDGEYKGDESVIVTFTNGENQLASIPASQLQHANKSGQYYAYTLDIGSTKMREPITVTISNTDGEIFKGQYSVEGYALLAKAAAEQNSASYQPLANVTKALVYYSDKLIEWFAAKQS